MEIWKWSVWEFRRFSRNFLGQKVREDKKRKVGELVMTFRDGERGLKAKVRRIRNYVAEIFSEFKNINYDVRSSQRLKTQLCSCGFARLSIHMTPRKQQLRWHCVSKLRFPFSFSFFIKHTWYKLNFYFYIYLLCPSRREAFFYLILQNHKNFN